MTRSSRALVAVLVVAATLASSLVLAPAASADVNPVHPDNRPSTIPGATNGWLPWEQLLHVSPSCVVYHRAAPSLIAMIAAARRDGINLVPSECYRDYFGQVAVRESWCQRGACHMAAVPGTSNHGWAKAVDFSGLTFESAAYHWLKRNAWWFGWNHPGVMEPGGPVPEPWHWEWVGDGGRMFPGITFGFGYGYGIPLGGNPAGRLDWAVTSSMNGWQGTARVVGWAVDPDTTAPVDVHLYVDGRIAGAMRANRPRPDVAEALAGYAASHHGFDGEIPALYGRREICAYGINTGSGENALLNCVVAPVGQHPIGSFDEVSANGTTINVRGWALDADWTGSIDVHAYVNGRFAGAATANRSRPDVDAVFPRNGTNHGFEFAVSGTHGNNTVCLYGINTGPGDNNLIACRDVVLQRNPFGYLDAIWPTPGGLVVWGWAIDPDTTGPVEVHTYIDGRFAGAIQANTNRPDVGAAFPSYGPHHGYTAAYAAAPGFHTVCTYGINVGPGSTVLLQCKNVFL